MQTNEVARPSVRLMTMNVFAPENPDWERRRRLIARTIEDLAPDVIARVDLGITDLARETLPWTETVIVELETPVGTLVVAHHKPSWPFPAEAEREHQAVMAAKALEEYVGSLQAHVVVLGDFDATPDSASMQFWRGRRPVDGTSVCYQDAWEYIHPVEPGFTFELSNPLVRQGEVATAVTRKIDHILVRSDLHGPTLRVADCRRVLDAPVNGVWASDHYGVIADLVPKRPVGDQPGKHVPE